MVNNPRLYIAISTFFPLVGGAETQTLAQSQRLQEQGYPVKIVTFRHQAAWLAQETIQDVPVIRTAGLLLGKRERLPRSLQRLCYFLAMLVMSWTIWHHRRQFDVLQVCQFSILVAPLALACRLAGKPIIIVVISTGSDQTAKTRKVARLIAGPINPTTPWLQVDTHTWIEGDLYGFKRAGEVVARYTRFLLEQIEAVVVVLSTRMQDDVSAHHLGQREIRLIPNGVDTLRFQPALQSRYNKRCIQTVICISQLRYEKGIDVLLQAWHLVHRQLPEARLIIVGNGPLQAQLERLAEALDIIESVEFSGLRNDVPAQLHRGSIAVLPSRWEGMPNALLESMASGLACVATRVSGSEDLLQDGINGRLVASENYQALADALLALLQDPALIQQYGQAARLTIEQSYSLEHSLHRYMALYHSMIAHKQITKASQGQILISSR